MTMVMMTPDMMEDKIQRLDFVVGQLNQIVGFLQNGLFVISIMTIILSLAVVVLWTKISTWMSARPKG